MFALFARQIAPLVLQGNGRVFSFIRSGRGEDMKKSYAGMAASVLLAGMLAVAGCGGTEQKAAEKPANGLKVYTSVYNGMVQEMAKPVVAQQLKDVQVDWQTTGSEQVEQLISDNLKQGDSNADVVMISDPSFYLQLKKDGKLLNYKSKEAAELAVTVDADGAFTPIRMSAMVIAVNRDKIEDVPESWEDLLDPKYKGKIAMPDPNVSATSMVTVMTLAD